MNTILPHDQQRSNDQNKLTNHKQTEFNVLLTNARSLAPKFPSLLDHIEENDIAVSIISESWLKPGAVLEQEIDDLRNGESLDLFHHSRKISSRGRPAGGGVAIISNRARCSLKEFKITRGKTEIVCAVGRIVRLPRKLVVIAIYISPRCKAPQVKDALEKVADAIRKIKETFPDPYIIVGGDFNRVKIDDTIGEFPDLHICLLYTSPSPRDRQKSRMPSSA